jgi:hypothetical protein
MNREQLMSMEAIRPSTLDGIKRLAKVIKQQQGIQHVRALDEAAKAAGYQSFRHATNVLGAISLGDTKTAGRSQR